MIAMKRPNNSLVFRVFRSRNFIKCSTQYHLSLKPVNVSLGQRLNSILWKTVQEAREAETPGIQWVNGVPIAGTLGALQERARCGKKAAALLSSV